MYVANVPLDRAEFAILHSHQSLNSTMKSLIFLLITIVHLGVDLGVVTTKATLADAFRVALSRSGRTVTHGSSDISE